MSPDGYHIAVIGPEGNRSEFRESFIQSVTAQGVENIVYADFFEDSLMMVRMQVDEATSSSQRSLLIVENVTGDEEWAYVLKLLREGRLSGLTVLTEFDGAVSRFARRATIDSYTVVAVGDNREDTYRLMTGNPPPNTVHTGFIQSNSEMRPALVV